MVRFRAPEFDREEIPRGKWGSIGSGEDVARYQAELEALTTPEADGLMQLETSGIGGYAHGMRIAVISNVFEQDLEKGISKHFHHFMVTAEGFQAGDSGRTLYPGDGPPQRIALPEVAEDWAQLQPLLTERLGTAPAIALA